MTTTITPPTWNFLVDYAKRNGNSDGWEKLAREMAEKLDYLVEQQRLGVDHGIETEPTIKDSVQSVLTDSDAFYKAAEESGNASDAAALKLIFRAWDLTIGIEPSRKKNDEQKLIATAQQLFREFEFNLFSKIRGFKNDSVQEADRQAIRAKLLEVAELIDAANS